MLQLRSVDRDATEYAGLIGVGTRVGPHGRLAPQAELRVIYDTGSADLWLSSDLCTKGPCAELGHEMYDHRLSDTFEWPPVNMKMATTYDSGELRGKLGSDDVRVGGLVARHQPFGLIAEERGEAFSLPFDGIVGLAFPHLATNGTTPLVDVLMQQGALPTPEFAFYLHADPELGGAVLWGGTDERLYEGRLAWFNVVEEHYWNLDLASFQVGNRTFLSAPRSKFVHHRLHKEAATTSNVSEFRPLLMVDSGTTFFTVNAEMLAAISNAGIHPMPCEEMRRLPPLVFTLRDAQGELRSFDVPPEEYMVSSGYGSGLCFPGVTPLAPEDVGEFSLVILGEVFMRYYFTVFSRAGPNGGARVGIARANHGEPAKSFFAEQPEQ